MNEVFQSLQSVNVFLTYFIVAIGIVAMFKLVYMLVTPHNEVNLIKEGNVSAAVQYAGAIIGFCIPLASAISHSVSLLDFISWSVVALVVQLAVFLLMSRVVVNLSKAIADNNVSVGIWVGATSIAAGIINAACMTY